MEIPYEAPSAAFAFDETFAARNAALVEYFCSFEHWKSGLLSAYSLAWLYQLVRAKKPQHIVEIGTFKGWTAQVLAYAAHANGCGTVHTVGPFDEHNFEPLLAQWPDELRCRLQYYPTNSMEFFQTAQVKQLAVDLVLVDGAHEYEFALFDIQCAARALTPGGYIFIDNISQPGPYQAVLDFCARNPRWESWGLPPSSRCAYDPHRSTLYGTDLAVLKRPRQLIIGNRPILVFQMPWDRNTVCGVSLPITDAAAPTCVFVQCALRGFSQNRQQEIFGESSAMYPLTTVRFTPPLMVEHADHYSVEVFVWHGGEAVLKLGGDVSVF
jgi:predicted O-methyltransferase YrrM